MPYVGKVLVYYQYISKDCEIYKMRLKLFCLKKCKEEAIPQFGSTKKNVFILFR